MMPTREKRDKGLRPQGVIYRSGPFGEVAAPAPARGFTLIELLVVMIIMTIVMAITIPRIGSNWHQIQDGDFLQQFSQAIRASRLFAMNSGLPVCFRLNGVNRVYGSENPPAHPIPLNVEIRANHLEQEPGTGDFIMTFYPDGSLVGDDVDVIFDNTRTYEVHINPLFGSVSIKRG